MKLRTVDDPFDSTAVLYTPCAPARGAAKRWVLNRDVWVLVVPRDRAFHNITSRRIKQKFLVATGADSRYCGTGSRYGRALNAAHAMLPALEEALEAQRAIHQMYGVC